MNGDLIYYLKNPDWCFTGHSPGLLPLVACEFCGQRVAGDLNLPLVPAAPFERWIFPSESFPYPEITFAEFLIIQSIGKPYLSEGAELVPGTSLGPFKISDLGHPHAILKEIEYAEPGGFLFSHELLGHLRQRGFDLPHQSFTLLDRKERPKNFGLIQVEAFRIAFHERTMREDHLNSCDHCGEVWSQNPAAKPSEAPFYLQRKYQRIAGDFFTFAPNAGGIFLSERAYSTLNELNPTGFSAKLAGYWLD
jgi:hypothetical protein